MGRCRHAPAAILLKGNAAILLEGGRAGPGRWRGAGRAPPTQGPCPPLSWRNGLDFSSCGQWEEAVICYSKAMNWIPRGIMCLVALNKFPECLWILNRNLEEDTRNPDLYVLRASFYERFGQLALCHQDIRRALEL
ncbi:tetratricopeptide repeat protein 16 isoform 2-T3 [Morphnus guianensis]